MEVVKRYVVKQLIFRVIVVLTLALLVGDLSAQNRFKHITISDGLSNNSVNNVIQTQDGYLWISTLNGLNRYDGHDIRSFVYEPGNPYSLSSNRIYSLKEDSLNYIWLLTYEYHVLRFNPVIERFIDITSELPQGILTGKGHVEIYNSSPSVVWITSDEGGIVRIQQKKDAQEFTFDYLEAGINAPSTKESFVYRDSKNKIWIGTQKGLMLLENDTVDFKSLTMSGSHIIDTSYYFTTCYEDKKGNVILGTSTNGIFESENEKLVKWNVLPDSKLRIKYIVPGKENDVLISTIGSGLYYINNNLQATNYKQGKISNYHNIFCDNTGTFWVRTETRGISMFNPTNGVLHHFDLNHENRESQGDSEKIKILEDSKGNLWFGVYGGGLFKFNRDKQDFDYYYHERDNSNSISSNIILSLFEDNSENLWIGTFKNGLNKLDLTESIISYKELVKDPLYNSQNEVRCITEDSKQRLWVGTKYGNIYCCDKNNNILFRIPEDINNKDDYIRSNVYELLADGNDLWVGTKGSGLYHIKDILDFDRTSNRNFKINVYQHDYKDSTSLAYNDIFSLFQDQYGQIWIGTYHGGISVIKNPYIDIKFNNYSSDASDPTSLSDDRIRKIYKDRENNLWICTVNGLNLLDSKYLISDIKRFKRFYRDAESVNSLTNNDIFDIHQDLKGTIWVATYGGGLNGIKLKSDSVKFKHYFRRDGLPSNIISSILEDDDLNLWLGTDNGLVKFSTQKYTTELIEYNDGYGHGIFSEGCKYKSANQDFIFGTQNGFIRFNPDSINIKKKEYPIILTGFKLFNDEVIPGTKGSPLNESIDKTKSIVLKYDQNFIGINFAVMDFNAPDKIQYSYILENYEKEWNKAINSSNATYRALPPGEYIFKLKATDSRGLLMDEVRELSIVIKPPFWRTKWALLAYYLLIILIIYFIAKGVRTRREISYENKLSEEKFKFFTNISHEFKTPLTLINNSIDDIDKATVFTKDVRSGIQLIKRNVQSLNGLIEQLISFRRLQKGKIELRVRKIEVVSYLNDIYLSFLPYAEKKELKFIFDSNIESYEGMIDVRYTDIIINNLLSNAFKHTPSNKKVVFKVNISQKSEFLVISIQDQGEGISQEHADNIFERFVFVENTFYSNFKGSGIGLSLAKEMVQMHKGSIKLNSKINEGSTFTVEIPLSDKFYSEQERTLSNEDSTTQAPKPFQSFVEQIDEQPSIQHKKAANAVKFKLLIIEDNKELREYMHDKLQKDNTVFVAVNGEEGVKLAKEVNPDLIITDLKMPKLDGIELTKLLKSDFETSHIPIILLTATSSIESKIEGIDSGADDYITKPFNMEYLKRRIVNLISQRKQLKEKFAKDPGFKPEKLTVSNNDQKFLSKVIELIETNIKTPNYTIDDIIVELGYSRSVFFKKMKSVSGYPPKEFVRIIKMKKAAELLRDPGVSVSEVSFNVGFSDPDYFRKSFKNFFGETPTSYQKKYR